MNNIKKYNQAFINELELPESLVNDELTYEDMENWDSVAHMGLVAELEEDFDIMMEIEDVINFTSYEKGKELLKKYGVEL